MKKNSYSNLQELWKATLAELQLQVSPANYVTWFTNTKITNLKDGEVVISVPSGFTKEWLENKYHKYILRSLRSMNPEIKGVRYCIVSNTASDQPKPSRLSIPAIEKEQPSLESFRAHKETNLNPRYTFDSFVVGSSNDMVFAASQAIVKSPGTLYNPFFVYGGVGLGKTHLLQALGNELAKKDKKVCYLTSEKFTNDLITALRNKKMPQFKERYRKLDVLIIDDIQFIAGKESTQEEFFHTFNELYEKNKQIIISSDSLPRAISTLEDRLRSRFEGGMIVDVGYPDYEMRVAVLKKKCEEKNIPLPMEVLAYIAEHIQKNIRELEGALLILAASQTPHQNFTVQEAQRLLKNIIRSPRVLITHKNLLKIVADFYNLTEKDLLSTTRRQEITQARQVTMYMMRDLFHNSYPFIGKLFGGKDHTTVMHACEKIKERLREDETFQQEFEIIKQRIHSA